jgi:hypothetical protein
MVGTAFPPVPDCISAYHITVCPKRKAGIFIVSSKSLFKIRRSAGLGQIFLPGKAV